jgi:hypothetical protein
MLETECRRSFEQKNTNPERARDRGPDDGAMMMQVNLQATKKIRNTGKM